MYKKLISFFSKTQLRGGILIQVIAFMTIGIIITSGFVKWSTLTVRSARQSEYREQAIEIAEAGVDYYRWHLAHAPSDFQDGTGGPGPYVHDFFDKTGTKLGTFTLTITPPPLGSTLVTVQSKGTSLVGTTTSRTLLVKFAKPSLARYAGVLNADVQFGAGTEFWGPLHSNGGIAFFGIAHNLVTSAMTTWTSVAYGVNTWGVHTYIAPDVQPPTAMPNLPTTFIAGRQISVPVVDFAGLSANMAQIKTDAQANGRYYAASGGLGYHIVLKTSDAFDIYRVNTYVTTPPGCQQKDPFNSCNNLTNSLWSIGTQTLLFSNVAFPANGLIFAEDHVWVDGQINTARLTIAAGAFPDSPPTRKNIIVNSNLLYTNYDGQDTLALMAQNSVLIGIKSANSLRIDAALVAQNGRLVRQFYNAACGTEYMRSDVTFYGMFASNQRYAMYVSCGGPNSGYPTRTFIYDPNLLYSPPPSFPLTTSQYQVVSWDEI